MDNNSVDLNESMVDLIERAEAFLTAHATIVNRTPPTTTAPQRNRSSSSNMFESSVEEQESFTTAADESPSTSRQGSTSSSSSSSGHSNDQAVELLTDDDSSDEDDELNDNASTISYEVDVPGAVPYNPPSPSDADDCIFISSVPVPTIDLCSPEDSSPPETPRTRQNRLRRAAESAPIVDLITLDDTIADQPELRRQPTDDDVVHTVEDTQADPPAAKRPKSSEPDMDLSQGSDGGAPSRSVVCPICFDSIFKKAASSTVCGHLFCYSCIKTEIQLRHKCPLCKRKLTRSQIHPIYFN